MIKDYEMVLGLEVHVELNTKTKVFCNCSTTFGAAPNSQCCPVCFGMPGALPVLNKEAVVLALKAGILLNCTLEGYSKQDRKNYFYPDLPKAYQISQLSLPLCTRGHLDIEANGVKKSIGITRLQLEEDAGKLIHDEAKGTLIDFNRCGVPLLEIVSEPDFRSPDEVDVFLKRLRAMMVYGEVSHCQMNKGQLRCDINLSIRKKGEQELGTRTEMKNINSFQFAYKAIEYEFKRQVDLLEKGLRIVQETRGYDENKGETFSMRSKEEAPDYRFFPDPDLAAIVVSKEAIEALRAQLPMMPDERRRLYINSYGLNEEQSETLLSNKYRADFFEAAARSTLYPKNLANLLLSEVFRLLPLEDSPIKFTPCQLSAIADMYAEETINSSTAKKLIKDCWGSSRNPREIVEAEGLEQINSEETLRILVKEVLEANSKSIQDYKSGKGYALKYIMGQIMAKTKGRANPKKVDKILKEALD